MAVSELKPCPFCGEMPELHELNKELYGEGVFNFMHRCEVFITMSMDCVDMVSIIDRWNTRTDKK